MAKTIPQVNTTSDTWEVFINTVMTIVDTVNSEILTANSTMGVTVGNAYLAGVFVSNAVIVSDGIRGGDISTPDTLQIVSSINVEGDVAGETLTVNGGSITYNGNTFNVNGALHIDGVISAGNAEFEKLIATNELIVTGNSATLPNTSAGSILPTTNTSILGNTTSRWQSVSAIDGNYSGNVVVQSLLTSNNSTSQNSVIKALAAETIRGGNSTVANTLVVTSAMSVNGGLTVNGTVTSTNSAANNIAANTLVVSSNATIANATLSGFLVPSANGVLLGNTTRRWIVAGTNSNFIGNTSFANVTVSGAITANNLTVQSNATMNVVNAVSMAVTGNLTVNSTLTANQFTTTNAYAAALAAGTIRGGNSTVANTLNIQTSISVNGSITSTANIVGATISSNVATINSLSVASNTALSNVTVTGFLRPTNNATPLGNTTHRWIVYGTGSSFSGNTDVEILNSNATISALNIVASQNVSSNNMLVSGDLKVDGEVTITGNLAIGNVTLSSLETGNLHILSNTTIVSNTDTHVVDRFLKSEGTFAKYFIAVNDAGTNRHAIEIIVAHNNSNTIITQYGEIYTANLGSFSANVDATYLNLLFTPSTANSTNNLTIKTARMQF